MRRVCTGTLVHYEQTVRPCHGLWVELVECGAEFGEALAQGLGVRPQGEIESKT